MRYLIISTIEFVILTIICVILFKKGIFGLKGFKGIFNIIIFILFYAIGMVILKKFIR